jgi:hypothetical protein
MAHGSDCADAAAGTASMAANVTASSSRPVDRRTNAWIDASVISEVEIAGMAVNFRASWVGRHRIHRLTVIRRVTHASAIFLRIPARR